MVSAGGAWNFGFVRDVEPPTPAQDEVVVICAEGDLSVPSVDGKHPLNKGRYAGLTVRGAHGRAITWTLIPAGRVHLDVALEFMSDGSFLHGLPVTLPGGKRYMLVVERKSTTEPYGTNFLKVVDEGTGARVGPRVAILR